MMAQRRGAIEEKRKAEKAEKVRAAETSSAAAPAESKGKAKLSYKQKFALENLPKEMEKAEKEIAAREAKMADPALFNKLAAEMEKLRHSLTAMEEEWLELEMLREELEG
jgi:ABC transport system ATP-binding/permease protein